MIESGINYYVHSDDAVECNIHCMKFMKDKIESALKLQESIKEYINSPESKSITEDIHEWGSFKSGQDAILEKIQSLIEESEKEKK